MWTTVSTIRAWHIAVGPMEPGGVRRVYAVGDSTVSYSSDGGANWTQDTGVTTINASRAALDALRLTCNPNDTGIGGFGGSTDIEYAQGAGAKMLAIKPGNPARVYMATEGAANGPTYYDSAVPDGTLCNTMCARLAGESSVWLGDFSQISTMNPIAQWTSLPGPPVYYGGSTPSSVTMVLTSRRVRIYIILHGLQSRACVGGDSNSDDVVAQAGWRGRFGSASGGASQQYSVRAYGPARNRVYR